MVIARGCTPVHSFIFPFTASEIEVMYITYVQNGELVLEKTKNDCTIGGGFAVVELTQEETLKFEESGRVEMQIRYRKTDGTAGKSNVMNASPDKLLKGGVI